MRILKKKQLLQFIEEHRGLFDAAGRQNPFACSAWLLHMIEQATGDDWRFAIAEAADPRDGLMLLYADGHNSNLRALTNYYSSLYSPLVTSAADRDAAARAVIADIDSARPRIARLNLAPLDQSAGDLPALCRGLSSTGWYVKKYFCFGNWYLPCAGLSFRAYMEQRPKQLVNTWTRKAKKFAAEPGTRLEIVTGVEDMDRAISAYTQVYAKSWKKPEPYPEFVPGWARICAQHGWLRLGLVWVNDVPIAAQFWFTMHGHAYIYKLAYDENYSKWSAGTLLTAALMEQALDQDRVVEIDYLTGDDAYKQTWMTDRRERLGVVACNPFTARGLLASGMEIAGSLRSRWRNRPRRVAPPAAA